MKTILKTFCLLALFSFSNCGNDDDAPPAKTFKDIDVVTGMNLYDVNGAAIGKWKDPNINPGDVSVFPNPCLGELFVNSQEKILRLWLIASQCKVGESDNIESQSLGINFEESELDASALRTFNTPNFQDVLLLDFSDLPKGFYKLFYETEEAEIFWQNLYIDPTVNNIPDLTALDAACN